MSDIEFWMLAVGMIFYVASCGLYRARFAILPLMAGLFFQAVSAGVRWYDIGHPPVFGTYEAALAGSWFLLLYPAFSYRSVYGHFRSLLLTTVPIAIFLLFYGLTFNTERIPLTISERSLWVDFHALFSWLAFGSYTAAACLAAIYLWKSGVRSHGAEDEKVRRWEDENFQPLNLSTSQLLNSSRLTSHEVFDDLIFRYINLGFINHTVMFALGSYYSSILFGTWWQWDLVNSASLITWLSYGLAIHMRLFYGWKGKRGANLAIIAFFTAIVSYWGLVYFPAGSTYHVFDIELKAH